MVPLQHDSYHHQKLSLAAVLGGGGGSLPPQVVEQEGGDRTRGCEISFLSTAATRTGGGQPPLDAQHPVVGISDSNAAAIGAANSSLLSCLLLNQLASEQQRQQQQRQQELYLHNLIPLHLQATALSESLHGTPGHQPALIPTALLSSVPLFTTNMPASTSAAHTTDANNLNNQVRFARDMCPMLQASPGAHTPVLSPPVYNGVNPHYPGLRVLHANPPIFAVDNFLTPLECDFLIHVAQDSFGPAPVVGKGAGELSPSRTSSTCYLAREDLPDVLRKVSLLTGKPMEHCELPQVGRYFCNQQYMQHFDAFDVSTEDGLRFAANGGQRTVTCLIYLNDVSLGGATCFPALNLQVQPRRGMCLVFFPSTIDGVLDKMALHAALPAVDTKYVSQVWIRQGTYNGVPSKRLPQILGTPLTATEVQQNRLVTSASGMAGVIAAAAAAVTQQQQPAQQVLLPPLTSMSSSGFSRF